MKQRGTETYLSADELAAGIAELEELFTRLSKGDTELRAVVKPDNDIFAGLKIRFNQMADHIQETNDYAHEMAIGLCEHYDTLNRIAAGDFSARAVIDSGNELITKLGQLINSEADVLTGALSRAQRAEEDKQAQLNLLQTLIDTIPSPVYYKDTEGSYLGCNMAFEAAVGMSRDVLLQKKAIDIWPVEQADFFQKQDQVLFDHPGVQVYEVSVRHVDGTQHEMIFNKATFHNEDGSLQGLVGIMLDITERKRAEDALLFKNILLSVQQEASIDGILVVDENAKILSYNRRFVEIMGVPIELLASKADEPVLKHVTERMLDPQGFLDKVRYLYEHRQENSRDELYLSDGKVLDRYTLPLLGDDGRYYGRLWSFRDITERKTAEEEIKNAYQQMQDIVEFLPDATFVVDKAKRVIAWNRAIEKMTGMSKVDVIGKGDYIYSIPFYGERRPILIDLIDEGIDVVKRKYDYINVEGKTLCAETFIPSFRNGGACYLWGTATPLFDKQGVMVGAIESIRDITEYKRAVEERSQLESQMHHARMMQSFMIRLGHDLRTPLTPLTILLPLIRKRVGGQEVIKLVDICLDSTTSMKKLADKAQLLASLSASIKPDDLERIALISVVERSLADCGEILAQKNIACQNDIDPAIVVHVVPDQIKELFVNLIMNSVHFSPENSIILISAGQQDETVMVAVRDDGIGLDPNHLDNIFESLFKADESRHDLGASGLGLTICKRIVLNHHGRIWAESPGIGQGTTIKFIINE